MSILCLSHRLVMQPSTCARQQDQTRQRLFWGQMFFGMGVVSCYPRSAAGGTSRAGGVLWVLGEALAGRGKCLND